MSASRSPDGDDWRAPVPIMYSPRIDFVDDGRGLHDGRTPLYLACLAEARLDVVCASKSNVAKTLFGAALGAEGTGLSTRDCYTSVEYLALWFAQSAA